MWYWPDRARTKRLTIATHMLLYSMTKQIEHRDIFGKPLQVGDFVVAPYYNKDISVFSVIKLNPKMIKLRRIASRGWQGTQNAYAVHTVKVDGPEVTMYVLKNSERISA